MSRKICFAPRVLRVDCAEVEVELPITGVMLTFRCGKRDEPLPHNLIEVSRMTARARWHGSILVSAGGWLNAKSAGADAIRAHRQEVQKRHR